MITDFDKKRKRNFSGAGFLLKVGGIIFLIVAAGLIFLDFKIYQKKQQLVNQINSYKQQIEEIKEKNESLKEQISKSDDKEYIEKIAREELDMQKEGEKVVSFVMPKQESKEEQKAESFWSVKFWFGWLGQSWQWIKNKF